MPSYILMIYRFRHTHTHTHIHTHTHTHILKYNTYARTHVYTHTRIKRSIKKHLKTCRGVLVQFPQHVPIFINTKTHIKRSIKSYLKTWRKVLVKFPQHVPMFHGFRMLHFDNKIHIAVGQCKAVRTRSKYLCSRIWAKYLSVLCVYACILHMCCVCVCMIYKWLLFAKPHSIQIFVQSHLGQILVCIMWLCMHFAYVLCLCLYDI